MAWVHQVVVIPEEQPIAASGGDTGVARGGRSASHVMANHFDLRKLCRQNTLGIVTRSLVDHDHFLVRPGLSTRATKRRPQQRRPIPCRYDDADLVAHA